MKPTEKTAKPTVECSPNGPYLVRGLRNLTKSRGESLPTKSVIALCRCGGSSKKPLCDGTHAKIGFSGASLADDRRDQRKDYIGKHACLCARGSAAARLAPEGNE